MNLPDKSLFDKAYAHVAQQPNDINSVMALEWLFSVFQSKMSHYLTERRLEYARNGQTEIRNVEYRQ